MPRLHDATRRVFLRTGASGFISLLLPATLGCGDRGERGADAGGDASPTAIEAGPHDAGKAPTLPPCEHFLTPIEDFPALFGGNGTVADWRAPEQVAPDHVLRISGLVSTPLSLSLDELMADTENQLTVLNTLQCVFGKRGTALWTGVPLKVLLDRAGIDRQRTLRLLCYGADRFDNNLKLEDIDNPPPEVFPPLVAFRIQGKPLPVDLGGPMRLLLCDRFGFKNIKWLEGIDATDRDEAIGVYQNPPYNYSDDRAVVTPNLRLTEPGFEAIVPAGKTLLCGHALSGFGGIERVQLSLDGQPYIDAQLSPLEQVLSSTPELSSALQVQRPEAFPYPFRGVWAPWQLEFTLEPGKHVIAMRTVDRAGEVGGSDTVGLDVV
ncbi:MAG: molybdopterin-dependent oxidoreductase [Myxococcales bacterium]|nr:molybdopterin-dependent oxidoreductase [Myxococcales bacterium]